MTSAFGVEHEISKSGIMPAIAENVAKVPHKSISRTMDRLVARKASKAKPSKNGFAHANGKVYMIPKVAVRNKRYKAGKALKKLGLSQWSDEVARGFKSDH